jgi:hypothetical protein
MWYVRAAGYTAIAAGTIYLIYCVFDMCNKESIPPYKNNDPALEEFHNQQQDEEINQQVSDDVSDEYSGEPSEMWGCLLRHEGLDNTIRNEKMALDARMYGIRPIVYPNTISRSGQPARLVSKTGRIVKRSHEERYKAKWEVYKRQYYPVYFFS